MLWKAVPDAQSRDLHSQPFSVARILDPDGRQVLRGHPGQQQGNVVEYLSPGDRSQVVAGSHEQPVVLVEADLSQPGGDEVIVD